MIHDGSIAHLSPGQRPGLAANGRVGASRWLPALGAARGAPKPGTARFAATRPGPAVNPPTAPSFETADERYVVANKGRVVAKGALVDRTRWPLAVWLSVGGVAVPLGVAPFGGGCPLRAWSL